MHHILFVCLGNICRSPMAEAIAKNIIKQQGLAAKFSVQSVATSPEEEGNPPYPEALATLHQHGLDLKHRSRPITAADFNWADTIITMDHANVTNLKRLAPSPEAAAKVKLCLDIFPERQGQAIADPWYTRKFELTYQELAQAIPAWLDTLSAQSADH